MLSDLLFTLLTNPCSGIFRRRYWEDTRIQLVLVLESFLTACAFFLQKMGEDFSRELVVVMYSGYAGLALVLKYLHKRRLPSRWSNRPQDSIKRVVLICSSQDAEEVRAAPLRRRHEGLARRRLLLHQLPPPAIDVFLQRPAAPSAGLLPLCSLTNADEVVILTAPSKTDDAAIEELMAEGLKVRISLAESLGVTAEMQEVGQIGIVKTLDLQRRSFGAAQTIHLSPSLHSTRCQTSRTARPLYPSQISRASLSSYDCNKSPCSL